MSLPSVFICYRRLKNVLDAKNNNFHFFCAFKVLQCNAFTTRKADFTPGIFLKVSVLFNILKLLVYLFCTYIIEHLCPCFVLPRDGSRFSGKGVHMYKSVGFALLMLSQFLKYPMKMK